MNQLRFYHRQLIVIVLIMPAVLLLTGCAEKKGSVTGKVTYKNNGVAKAQVDVFPSGGGPSFSAITDSDGSYRIDGVPVGQCKVTVVPFVDNVTTHEQKSSERGKVDPNTDFKNLARDKKSKGGAEQPKSGPATLPTQYASHTTTPLGLEVKGGANPFDITLKD